jgi:predicted ATP-binding protein involved in virulence
VAEVPALSPLAREAGDALAYLMDVNVRPPLDILEKIHEYEQLVRDGLIDSDKGREVKARLDNAGYEIPEADLALWKFLSQQTGKITL